MKRTKWLILMLVLCMAATLGGTIAYLTDTDGDVNVMTLGNVHIALQEWERGENGLQPFAKDKMMHPIVGDVSAKDHLGLPTNTAFLDKIVQVECTSQHANAYLRVYIGLPSALRNVDGKGLDALHMLTGEGVSLDGSAPAAWPWKADPEHSYSGVDIDGVKYDMLCYVYQPLLTPGDITAPVLAGLWLDSRLDSADDRANHYAIAMNGAKQTLDYDFSHGLQIPVLAQAVQADGFQDADAAFASAHMNDVNFDDLLDIDNSQPLSDTLKDLLSQIAQAFQDNDTQPQIPLTNAEYDLTNPEFSAQLQAISYENSQKQIELAPVASEGADSVTLRLGETSLPKNVMLVTDDQTKLIIIGN